MANQDKQTDPFKETIQNFLRIQAEKDSVFRAHLCNKDKNIDDCLTYIFNTIKNSQRQGFTDPEIYGFAMHYYEEKNVKIGGKIQGQVIVNHKIELTPKQIEEERQKAKDQIYREERDKLLHKKSKTTPKTTKQPDLFS